MEFAGQAFARQDAPSNGDLSVLASGQVVFSAAWLLANVTFDKVSYGPFLMLLYMGIFITAETAFVLMALREYLQDIVALSDKEIIVPS